MVATLEKRAVPTSWWSQLSPLPCPYTTLLLPPIIDAVTADDPCLLLSLVLRCLCLFLLLQVSVAVGVVVARVAFLVVAVILLDYLLHVVVVVCSSSNSDEDDDHNGKYNSSKPRQLLCGLHTVMSRSGALVGAKKSASELSATTP